jgi:hypothetical protein
MHLFFVKIPQFTENLSQKIALKIKTTAGWSIFCCIVAQGTQSPQLSRTMSQEEQENRKRASARQLTDRDDVDADVQDIDSVCICVFNSYCLIESMTITLGHMEKSRSKCDADKKVCCSYPLFIVIRRFHTTL